MSCWWAESIHIRLHDTAAGTVPLRHCGERQQAVDGSRVTLLNFNQPLAARLPSAISASAQHKRRCDPLKRGRRTSSFKSDYRNIHSGVQVCSKSWPNPDVSDFVWQSGLIPNHLQRSINCTELFTLQLLHIFFSLWVHINTNPQKHKLCDKLVLKPTKKLRKKTPKRLKNFLWDKVKKY